MPDSSTQGGDSCARRGEAEAALQKSEALFRAFFEANPVATIITSTSGVIHMVNPAFALGTDFTAEDVVGKTSQELGFWHSMEDRQRMVKAILERGFIDNLESTFYGKNRRRMTCLVSSRAIQFEGELRILSIVQDVTEQRAAEEALRKLDQAKSDFISTVAHELRTPLIAVIGYCELLEKSADQPLTETQKNEYITIIQSNAEMLNRLVDDLLDVGRIQVGRPLRMLRKATDLAGIIEKAVDSQRMKSRRHEILVVHGTPLPQRLSIDGNRIIQVLNNLLDNAIKYSPGGGIIKLQTMTDSDTVTVSVTDQGIGMTPEQVEHIFERFYRAEFVNVATSGLGLGMSIVKQVIVDHGGEIAVASRLGEGTTVSFTLPIKP